MRFGAVTLVGSVAGALTVLLLLAVLFAVRRLRSDMQAIRQRVDAEQARRDEIRRKVEEPDQPRRLRLVHRLPPTLLVLSALSLELVKRHPLPSLGLTGAAAGLAASAVFLTYPARTPGPSQTNPGRAVQPVTAVHAPAHGRTTPARKETVPAGTQSPDVPAGTAMSLVAHPTPLPSTAAKTVPSPTRTWVIPVPIPVRSLIPSTPLPLPTSLLPSLCVTVAAIPVCTP